MYRVVLLNGHLKSEYRKRLIFLRNEINKQLQLDDLGMISDNLGNLHPALFQVFSYMWCKETLDMIGIKGYKYVKSKFVK